jgi:hypothetical protein
MVIPYRVRRADADLVASNGGRTRDPIGHIRPGATDVPLRPYQLLTPPHRDQSAVTVGDDANPHEPLCRVPRIPARAKPSAERKQETNDASRQRA